MKTQLAFTAPEAHKIAKTESEYIHGGRTVLIFTHPNGYQVTPEEAKFWTGNEANTAASFLISSANPNDGSIFVCRYINGKAVPELEYIH